MLVDVEGVLLDLKKHLLAKPHWGQRELTALIARLEVENRVEESLPEQALRLYGLAFYEEAVKRSPPSEQDRVPASDGHQTPAQRGDSKETHEYRTRTRPGNVVVGGGRVPRTGAASGR